MSNNNIDITQGSTLSINAHTSRAFTTMATNSPSSHPSILPKPDFWWKSLSSIYQIYPASFLQTSSTPTPQPNSTSIVTDDTNNSAAIDTSSQEPNGDVPTPPRTGRGSIPGITTKLPYLQKDEKAKPGIPPPPTTGLGSLKGIISKLPYLSSLGIQCIWLSPVYPSPLIDMGYDVSNYTDIDPRFGTLDDMLELIQTAHDAGIRVLMDLVINHTSTSHHWFQESKKSREGKYADFYIWKDPKIVKDDDGRERKEPPNNWGSFFGGSAWEWVEERGQYYMHLFDYRQADLDWESSKMRQTVYDDAIRFWLDRGVDGFRIDTAGIYAKDQRFEDGEVDPDSRFGEKYGTPFKAIVGQEKSHTYWQEIRREVLAKYGDVLMIGELGGHDKEEIMKYVGRERKELSMVFDFEMAAVGDAEMAGGFEKLGSWSLPDMKGAIGRTQDLVATQGGWAAVFSENHDIPRTVSRFGSESVTRKINGERMKGNEKYWERSAKMLCLLLTTLSGNLVIYEGQEIGMTNIPESWSLDDLMDIVSIEYYHKIKKEHPGDKELLDRVWKGICVMSRDNARTPMQWTSGKNAGFSSEKPWMKVNDNHTQINVENQTGRKDSVWSFWRKMLNVRNTNQELLIQGSYQVQDYDNEKTFVYEKRTADCKAAVVVLNWTDEGLDFELPEAEDKKWELEISNIESPGRKLGPWEGRLYIAT